MKIKKAKKDKKIGAYSSDVAWRKVDEEAVILNLKSSVYYSLNEVGTRIWELIGEGCELDEIVITIADEYDTSEKKVKKDVEKFIKQMKKEKLLSSGKK